MTRRRLLAAALLGACIARKQPTRTAREIDEAYLSAMIGPTGRPGYSSADGSPRVAAALRRWRKRKRMLSDQAAQRPSSHEPSSMTVPAVSSRIRPAFPATQHTRASLETERLVANGALRADKPLRPADALKVVGAGRIVRKEPLKRSREI